MHKGKTECMLFGTGPRLALSTSFSEAIDGKELSRVSGYKYLVVGLFSIRRLRGMRPLIT